MRIKKLSDSGVKLMQGNEACAAGALAADCRFMAGYPITPATEIPEYLSSRMFAAGGVFMQMEDELASINAVIGASWGGARAMTATSGPGFTLMQEALGYAAVTEPPLVRLFSYANTAPDQEFVYGPPVPENWREPMDSGALLGSGSL